MVHALPKQVVAAPVDHQVCTDANSQCHCVAIVSCCTANWHGCAADGACWTLTSHARSRPRAGRCIHPSHAGVALCVQQLAFDKERVACLASTASHHRSGDGATSAGWHLFPRAESVAGLCVSCAR